MFTLLAHENSRFLYIRMLLLRPVLLSACSDDRSHLVSELEFGSISFEQHFIATACEICVKMACALIESIHANLYSMMRNSVWYTVYCKLNLKSYL